MSVNPPFAPAMLAVLAIACVPAPAQAAYDQKSVSPSICQPFAPDTTAAEIQVTQTGIYNPGTAIEKVICALPRDAETAYTTGSLSLAVYYRVLGGAPGRVSCTIFIGSTSMPAAVVATTTASGPLVSGGDRSYVAFNAPAQVNADMVSNTLICAISPKTSLGSIYVYETGVSDVP
jgi:hypothetical protein